MTSINMSRRHAIGHTNPTILAYIKRSFNPFVSLFPRKTSGPSPSRSSTPGRNGSMTMSAVEISFLRTFCPPSVLRLIAIEYFPRDKMSLEEVTGLSTRITSDPLSARIRPVNGPGAKPANYANEDKYSELIATHFNNLKPRKCHKKILCYYYYLYTLDQSHSIKLQISFNITL